MEAKIIPLKAYRMNVNESEIGFNNDNGIRVSQYMPEFLKYAEGVYTAKTVKHFRTAFNEFIRIAGDVPVRSVGIREVESFLAAKKSEASTWTAAKYYTALSSAWSTALRWGYVEENIFRRVKKPVTYDVAPGYFTREDFDKLLSVISDKKFMQLIKVAVYTGLRLNEILYLRWTQIDFTDRVIRIQNTDEFKTKNKRNRVVPMHDTVISIMNDKSKRIECEYVFSRKGKRLGEVGVSKRFKNFVRKAGLSDKLRFHSLRHTCATWLIKAGVPIYEVQLIMGHSNISTTERYLHLTASDLHKSVNKINF